MSRGFLIHESNEHLYYLTGAANKIEEKPEDLDEEPED